MNRMKRDASDTEYECVSACFRAVEAHIQNETESIDAPLPQEAEGPVSLGQAVCYLHNPIWLKPACSVYENFRQCMTKCPNDIMKNMTLHLVEPFEFICTDRIDDAKDYLPCIFETCNKTHPDCDRKCRRYEKILEHMPNEKHDAARSEKMLEIENQLTHVCKYADCSLDCMYRKIKRQCGLDSANLEREFIREIFVSIQEFFSYAPDFEWPEACEVFTINSDDFFD